MLSFLVAVLAAVTGCKGSRVDSSELVAVDYTPITTDIWSVSTPEEQGLDPELVAEESLQSYSKKTWKYRVGPNWKANEYGYQWWSIKAGDYRYHLAWGHGGQQIVLVDELDLVIVLLVDPLYAQHGDESWKIEKGNLNLLEDFVDSLP